MSWVDLVRRIGKGTGKNAELHRAEARIQLDKARKAVPVWIMPLARLAESFTPGEKFFDIVILDEASQCDLGSLLAFTLGKNVIVVGDDEQVSPLDIGQTVETVRALQDEWLGDFQDRALYDGRASAYEIAKRCFPGGLVRLTEHFRCVPDIIAFSNGLSYKNEIKPLRESNSAKVFPPVLAHRVVEGERMGAAKVNRREALEIASLVVGMTELPEYAGMELGVVSLLGDQQARDIDTLLRRFLDPNTYRNRRIICGTAAHFQGDERDVMLLSMVDSSTDEPLRMMERDEMKKRYNVAASRARDQMWVVYSLNPETDLKPGDLRLKLLEHAKNPSAWRLQSEIEGKAQSDFEKKVLGELVSAGFKVLPQVEVGSYRIDIVVEGSQGRVAIECDGDKYHALERLDHDLERQAVMERLGWRFIRIRGSTFQRNRLGEMKRVVRRLEELGIDRASPTGASKTDGRGAETREKLVRHAADIRSRWLSGVDGIEALFATATPTKRKWGRR